jgi:hypothetical protein
MPGVEPRREGLTQSAPAQASAHADDWRGSPVRAGFVTGYWSSKDDAGLSMFIFKTEAAARCMSEQAAAAFLTESRSIASKCARSWRTRDTPRGGGRHAAVARGRGVRGGRGARRGVPVRRPAGRL